MPYRVPPNKPLSVTSKLAAAAVLASPAVVAVATAQLDKSALRHFSAYSSCITVAVCASLFAAVLVPAIVIWRLPIPWAARFGVSAAALVLLIAELYVTFFFVVVQR